MPKTKVKDQIEISPIVTETITCYLVGTSPLIMHRFPKKAWQELLFPKGRINAAERAENLKHDPLMEFRESIYKNRNPKEPAAVHIPSGSFTKALASAALDLPGATRAQILRLVSVESLQINLYGIPQMFMAMTRSSDIARTPDVRTRAIFAEWACEIEFAYVSSLLKPNQVVSLLSAAGIIVGVGDWRPQKGGPFGKFAVVQDDDQEWHRIVRDGARDKQLAAMEMPVAYDADTEELYGWFLDEAGRREKHVPSAPSQMPPPKSKAKRNGRAAHA